MILYDLLHRGFLCWKVMFYNDFNMGKVHEEGPKNIFIFN